MSPLRVARGLAAVLVLSVAPSLGSARAVRLGAGRPVRRGPPHIELSPACHVPATTSRVSRASW